MGFKFLKHGLRVNGKYVPAHYSKPDKYVEGTGIPEGTITVYAKNYGSQFPKELKPENTTDYQTDYFETDRIRIAPSSKHYKKVLAIVKAKEEKLKKRMLQY